MPYIIGVDEAGYGPNLGPLVISLSVWEVPVRKRRSDLYELLQEFVTPLPPAAKVDDARVVLGDSKALYIPGRGLGLLERNLLAAVYNSGPRPESWLEAWRLICPGAEDTFAAAPWFLGYDRALPLECARDEIEGAADRLRAGLRHAALRLRLVRSRAVFPDHWNRLLGEYSTKGEALSNLTLELLGEVTRELDGPVAVVCDKHGGRNRYQALLQRHFAESVVEVYGESGESSLYRFGPRQRRVEVCFRPRAESFLPTALASMASKYLRELAMRAFNDFWCGHLPELRRTAGYYRDASRFKNDIGAVQASLGIDDAILWRVR